MVRRLHELHPELEREGPPAGSIRNVLISNVIARGQGTSLISGHLDNWLDGVRLENDVERSALRDEDSPQAGSSPGNK
jgi:hypothetical protein